jgi:hypothetical protein
MKPGTGNLSPSLFDCVDSAAAGTKTLEIYEYIGLTILFGECSDYKFYWELCCRAPAIDNITNSSSRGFYFEATLNNMNGKVNTSPYFTSEPVKTFCVGNNFNWKHTAIEPDGDSIHYSLIHTREYVNNAAVNILYDTGWTVNHPVKTPPGYPGILTLYGNTGYINFTPIQQEIDVLAVLVEEFRYDSILNQKVLVGSSNRDMMITIAATCSQNASQGNSYNFNELIVSQDTAFNFPVYKPNCNDTSITLYYNQKIDCTTIAQDGSDYGVVDMQTMLPFNVKSASFHCNSDGETQKVTITFDLPLSYNGEFYLYPKSGNDGNPLVSKCGYPMNESDTLIVKVENCSGIGVEEQFLDQIEIYPNPTENRFVVHSQVLGIHQVEITNTQGVLIKTINNETRSKKMQVNLEDQPAGMYIISLQTSFGSKTLKLIKH